MNYEAGFCVFAFVAFCAVMVYALYRRALKVDESVYDDWASAVNETCENINELLSRDDVLELTGLQKPMFSDFPYETGATPSVDEMMQQIAKAACIPVDMLNGKYSASSDKPIPKGWQPWEGGAMPLPYNTEIAVMFGDGLIQYGSIAGEYFWNHCGDSDEEITTIDILSYRIAD